MENETKNELITGAMAKTENQLIVEFMKSCPKNYDFETYCLNAQYNLSWDWLMPVWIKFRDLEYQKVMLNHSHWRSIISNQLYLANDPSELFPLLVNAIKWYNETQSRGGGN